MSKWLAPLVGVGMVAMGAGTALADPPPVKRTDVEVRARVMFARADLNHDGWLTRDEYHRTLAAIAKARGATPTVEGWSMVDAQFDAIDQVHAGTIPRANFVAAALAHFDGADLNHDGIVTVDEARKAAKIKNRMAKEATKKGR